MKIITIYTDTHHEACLYSAEISDADVYDENIDNYFSFVESEAEKSGFVIEYENSGPGRSYYTDDDDAERFMQTLPAFWEWYN